MREPLDYVTAIIAVFAGLAGVAFLYLPERMTRTRVAIEVIFELGMFVLLVISLHAFRTNTEHFQKRIRAGLILMYAAAVFSVVTYIMSTFFNKLLDSSDPFARFFSWRSSQIAWTLFLLTSVAAWCAYATVAKEIFQFQGYQGTVRIIGLLGASVISFIVIVKHAVICLVKRSFRWRITAYHSRLMKFMTCFFALLLTVVPTTLLVTDRAGEEPYTSISGQDIMTFLIDVIAAFLHRMSLQEFWEQHQADVVARQALEAEMCAEVKARQANGSTEDVYSSDSTSPSSSLDTDHTSSDCVLYVQSQTTVCEYKEFSQRGTGS